ncbi:MAG: hypothetical protein C4338_02725 [Rhodanobacteraceae bacterium]
MAEVTLQLDEALMTRLRAVARTRGCMPEELIAQLLDQLPPQDEPVAPNAQLWDAEEAAFLENAAQAFDSIPAGEKQRPDDATEWDKPLS